MMSVLFSSKVAPQKKILRQQEHCRDWDLDLARLQYRFTLTAVVLVAWSHTVEGRRNYQACGFMAAGNRWTIWGCLQFISGRALAANYWKGLFFFQHVKKKKCIHCWPPLSVAPADESNSCCDDNTQREKGKCEDGLPPMKLAGVFFVTVTPI